MSEIVHRAAANLPERGGPAREAARALGNDRWTGTVTAFDDVVPNLPMSTPEITSGVDLDTRVRRRGESYYRRGLAWRAERDRLVVAVLTQTLRPRTDGRFATVGPWAAQETLTSIAVGPVRRRHGTVPQGPVADPAVAPCSSASTAQALPTSLDAIGYLPVVVQRGFLGHASDPLHEGAEIVQVTRADGSRFHRVSAFRLGTDEAVVLLGSRQGGGSTWQVEQLVYPLAGRDAIRS